MHMLYSHQEPAQPMLLATKRLCWIHQMSADDLSAPQSGSLHQPSPSSRNKEAATSCCPLRNSWNPEVLPGA